MNGLIILLVPNIMFYSFPGNTNYDICIFVVGYKILKYYVFISYFC